MSQYFNGIKTVKVTQIILFKLSIICFITIILY